MWSENHKEKLGKLCSSCNEGTECTSSDVSLSHVRQRD